ARLLPRGRRTRSAGRVGGAAGAAAGRPARGSVSGAAVAFGCCPGGRHGREGREKEEKEVRRPILVLTLVLLGCTRSASNHEELGDRSYAAAAYADALAEYQLGRRANAGSATLLAKVAAAAMHTEDYALAAESYRALAQRDRSR